MNGISAHIQIACLALLIGLASMVAASEEESLRRASDALKSGNPQVAFAIWLPIAQRGDSTVQEWIGDMYRKGEGVTRDHTKARQWYMRSASAGAMEGMCSLARLLSTSSDPKVRDGAAAVPWARKCVAALDLSETRNILALAFAEAGRFNEALHEQRVAVEMFRAGRFVRSGELREHEKVYAEQAAQFAAGRAWHSEI